MFWARESDPAAKRQLLALIFDRVWLDEQRIVAVQPKAAFAPFFSVQTPRIDSETPGTGARTGLKERERRDSNPRPLP